MNNIRLTESKKSIAIKKIGQVCILQLLMLAAFATPGVGQYTLDRYANNDASIERLVTTSEHFNIVFPANLSKLAAKAVPAAEQAYKKYEAILGSAPDHKITIYINSHKQFLNAEHALNLSASNPLWQENIFVKNVAEGSQQWKYLLRYEIAYAFQQSIYSSKLGLVQNFLLSEPSLFSWSAGLPYYLAVPGLTEFDVQWLSNFWDMDNFEDKPQKWPDDFTTAMLGRSQIHFFNNIYSYKSLKTIYTDREYFLGQSYFDFSRAFYNTAGVKYLFFADRWKEKQLKRYNESSFKSRFLEFAASKKDSASAGQNNTENLNAGPAAPQSHPYRSFLNIAISRPIVLPYYVNTSDFGIGGLVSWQSPLRLHTFLFAGALSVPAVQGQSIFYTSYVNNTLGPRIKLSYKHYSSASGFLDLSVKTTDAAAISSLWKIDALSRNYSNWYAGLMIRKLSINYFSETAAENEQSTIVFDNTRQNQTDLRLSLAWRDLTPSPHNIIHPADGRGMRLAVTGSGAFLNQETQYVRFHAEGFLLLPSFGRQRIYIYGSGAFDLGDPIGRDYLVFTNSGNYELPEPRLIGSASPGVEGYIRGYSNAIAGERFLWGTVEYRIPLILDSGQYLFGFIPPARTALAIFADAGVMGGARAPNRSFFTAYRYSVGTEIKRVLGFDKIKLTYKVGIAQALNLSFSPQLYFTVQSAIPF